MKNPKKTGIVCAIAAATTLFAMSAMAQQSGGDTGKAATAPASEEPPPPSGAVVAPPSGGQADKAFKGQLSSGIETVVVTAQKRKEDPNKIAMSISAISGEALQEQHVTDITDLTRSVPNISFSQNNGAGPGLTNIEMRGVSSEAGSSTVAVYMDDTSVTVGNVYSMGTVEPKFFDLDRVEVLRGPQGTLYGASSMGGTIKFVANQPDLKDYETDVFAQVSSTKGGSTNTSGYLVGNIPLVKDELALRIGVQANNTSGFISQVDANGNVVANGINSSSDQEARIALKWKPTKDLTILPSVYYQLVNGHGNSAFDLSTLPNYQTSILVREPSADRLVVPNLTVNYDMEIGTLTSVSSFFQREFNRTLDGRNYVTAPFISTNPNSGCYIYVAACGGTVPDSLLTTINGLPSPTTLDSKVQQFSEELRLASKAYDASVSPWTWVGGLYFANERTTVIENDPISGLNAAFAQNGIDVNDLNALSNALYFPGNAALGIAPGTPYANPFPNDNLYYGYEHLRDQQSAVFGEANYYFNPTLHATVGVRYLTASDSIFQTNGLYLAGFNTNAYSSLSNAESSRATTPKFALTWEVDPTNTVYTSAAKGFRLGGGNEFVPPQLCAADLQALNLTQAPGSYEPDSLWSYEVGNKSRFLNNRLAINADVYYLNWKNLQQYVVLPTCQYEYNTNVGNATSKGAEIDIKFKPVPQWLLGFSAGYTKAVLSDNDGLNKDGIVGAVAGAQIEGVPDYNAQLSAKYNFVVMDDKSGYVLAAMHWVGSSHGSLDPTNPDYYRPQYHTLDLSAGMSFNAFDIGLFVKNALDDDTIIMHPNVNATLEGYRVNPREIGLNIAAKF